MTGALTLPQWGTEIIEEPAGESSFRMYAERPRHLESLLDLAARWGDRPHIVQGDRVITFADLHRNAKRAAVHLRSRGAAPGDRVFLLGWNSPEWIVNYWAITLVGAVPVLANAWWSAAELDYALTSLDPALVVVHPRITSPSLDRFPHADWAGGFSEGETPAVADGSSDREPAEGDPCVVIFTSGTEGQPKAVELSHRSLLSGLQMLLHITKRLPHQVSDEDGEPALHTGPMFHIGGVQTLLRSVVVGDTLVMPAGRFDAGEALRLIEEWRVRRWSAVPTMVTRLLEHPDVQVRDVTSLRAVTVGGAPVTAEFLERLRGGLPGVNPRVATGYGLTENGGQAVAASGNDTVLRPGTTGRALPCVEISIRKRGAGEDGEILVRSPTQMTRYIASASTSPIDAAGWLHTGDLGTIDLEGYLWITGRSKDMIIRGGENIAPAAVEEALVAQDGVKEAVVFGVPDAEFGEEVAAVIVAPAGIDTAQLQSDLRGVIASFSIPTRWEIRSEPLETNHAGKVDKPLIVRTVRERLEQEKSVTR